MRAFTCYRNPILSLFILCIAVSAVAADELNVADVPGWVADRRLTDLETGFEEPSDEVLDILIDDRQVIFEPGSSMQFTHGARRANSIRAVGLVSNINVPYIPAYQSLSLHYVRVFRDGEAIDKENSVQVRYTRQDSAEPDELDEFVTVASMLIGGVKAGDVVEYALSVSGRNPNFDGVYAGSFAYGAERARDVYRRVLVPRDTELDIKLHRDHPEPEVMTDGRHDVYEWNVGEVEKTEPEKNVPVWYFPLPTLEFSNQIVWSDVSSWALDRFRLPDQQSDAVTEVASDLAAGLDLPRQKLLAALRFVQSEVRYIGPGIGRNGYRPYSPEKVLDRLYGDCKDKVFLLQALLDSMGIESWSALVNANSGKLLDGRPRAPTLFNHAILHARIGDTDFWVDPTMPPAQNDEWALRPVYEYGRALVIREGENSLTDIPSSPAHAELDRLRYETVIDLERDQSGGPTALMRWRLRGSSAEGVSQTMDFMSDRELEQFVKKTDLQDRTDIAVIEPPETERTPGTGELVIESLYDVSSLVRTLPDVSGAYIFTYPLFKFEEFVDAPPRGERSMPYALPYPFALEEHVVANLGAKFFQPLVFETAVETDHFRYSAVPAWDGESFSVAYSYETRKDHVAPAEYASFRSNLERLLDRQLFAINVRADAWPDPGIDEEDIESGISLTSFVEFFERENEELGIGIGEPAITAEEITDAIQGWDRNKVPVSDEILDVYKAVARHQRVPDSMDLFATTNVPDMRGGSIDVYLVELCFPLPPEMGYCLPIRKNQVSAP